MIFFLPSKCTFRANNAWNAHERKVVELNQVRCRTFVRKKLPLPITLLCFFKGACIDEILSKTCIFQKCPAERGENFKNYNMVKL